MVEGLAGGAGCDGLRPSKVNSGAWSSMPHAIAVRRCSCSPTSSPMRGPCGTRRLLPNLPPRTTSRQRLARRRRRGAGAGLTDAQPEPVARGEDACDRSRRGGGLRVVRERGRPHRAGGGPGRCRTGTGSALRGDPAAASLQRRGLQQLLADGPVQQAAHDAEQSD